MHETASQHDIAPIGSPVQLFVQLLKLSSLISGPMQDGVADQNALGLNEIKILMCLGGEGAMAGHDITEVMAIPPMNVRRALANLRARGWIEPVVDLANRRRKPFQLSADGWKAHRELTPDVAAVAEYILGALTPSERAAMARATDKVIGRMSDWFVQYHAGTHINR
jgi:DNA-binding MarR family transcriptional regulator